MEYESDILKRLIKTYGVVGNPRYISEIIKEFIVQGKERFPELFTYQADWLAHIDEFGLNPSYTVSYTGQSIYAPNTLERPVKRAILKGSTKYRDIDTGEVLDAFEDGRNLELVSVKMPVLTTTGKNLFNPRWLSNSSDEFLTVESDGSVTLNGTLDFHKWFDFTLPEGTYYPTCSFNGIHAFWNGGDNCFHYDGRKITLNETTTIKGYISSGTYDNVNFTIQLEEGSVATSYEPYKSNILTVNEEVELGSVGEVKDELNLLTGQLTQRIGEVVLNGSESWKTGMWKNQVEGIGFEVKIKNDVNSSVFVKAISDKILYNSSNNFQKDGEYFDMVGAGNGETWIRMRILRSKLSTEDVEGFKKWLSQNNVKILYELSDKPIKTVDLTILDQNGQNVKQLMSFNGGTHFNTGSLEGSPLPSVTVTVETDLEETLRVCSLDGNTM